MATKCVIHVLRDTGGVGKMVLELANEQVSQGYKVVVVHTNLSPEFVSLFSPKVHIEKININSSFPPIIFGLGIREIYFRYSALYHDCFCLIHVHNMASIGVLSRIRGIPIFCTIHGISWFGKITLRKRLSQMLVRKLINKVLCNGGQICGVSEMTSSYYIRLGNTQTIQTVYNGLLPDVNRMTHDKFVVGHIGDISDSKGWKLTLDAYCKLPKEVKPLIDFISAGRPVGCTEQQIDAMIQEKASTGSIRYLGMVNDAYHKVMPFVDVLVLPSISEGLPMSIIEAQSLGIPVIATNVGGIAEIIEDNENGYIVTRDATDICKKIMDLYENRCLYDQMSSKSQELFSRKLSVTRMCSSYEKLYEQIEAGVII